MKINYFGRVITPVSDIFFAGSHVIQFGHEAACCRSYKAPDMSVKTMSLKLSVCQHIAGCHTSSSIITHMYDCISRRQGIFKT